MKKHCLLILCFAVLLLISGCTAQTERELFTCVMLPECEGMTIKSANPLYVPMGQDAVFEVSLSDAYKIDKLEENAVFDGSTITLRETVYPHTVKISTAKREKCIFSFQNDKASGKLQSSVSSGIYLEGTEITMQAEPNLGRYFHSYSLNASVRDGGTILSLDPEYTFFIESDMEVFVNYTATPSTTLIYHANGGTVNGKDSMTVLFDDDFWLCPNTPISDGSFVREGYVLLGFNSEKDGSGDFYGTGWNIPVTDKEMEFWAVWAEETPLSCFTYEIKSGKAAIRGYTGDYETVVIPEMIEGCPVTKISPRAFKESSLHTLVLGKNITSVQANAFSGCTSFETLYITDSVTTIPGMRSTMPLSKSFMSTQRANRFFPTR